MTEPAPIELSKVMALKLGSVDPSKHSGETFDLYSIPSFDLGEPEVVTGAEIGSTKQIIEPGDVLLSKIVPHIRRAWVVGHNRGRRIIASGEWIVFRGPSVHPQYLRHVLVGDPFHAQFMRTVSGVGGSLLRARPSYVAKISIPLPPISEQRRIAEVLDRAEALRAKRRAALAQLDTLTRSIFLERFGDPARSPWPVMTISRVASASPSAIRTGPFGSQLLHSEFVDHGIAVLGIDNVVQNRFQWSERRFITESKYQELKRYTVRPGDVLITIMGTCGRCAVVPNDVPLSINTKHLCCITLDQEKCLPSFLQSYFLHHPVARDYLSKKAKGAIMEGLNMGVIREMPVFLPPLQLQREFGSRMEEVGSLVAKQHSSLVDLDSLFASLQHRAFRGEL